MRAAQGRAVLTLIRSPDTHGLKQAKTCREESRNDDPQDVAPRRAAPRRRPRRRRAILRRHPAFFVALRRGVAGGGSYDSGAPRVVAKPRVPDAASLAGKKIRTLPNPVITECLRLMGAAATPMAFGEIYTALQAGVLDGLEHDPPTIVASKFYETAKFYTLTEHIFSPLGIFMGDASYKKLPPPLRDGFLAAAKAAAIETRVRGLAVEKEALDVMKQQGVTVAACDKEAFRQ